MSIVSVYFILFFACLIIAYYAVPKKIQWIVLLAFSCLFYLLSGWTNILFILTTAATVFFGARLIDRKNHDRREYIRNNKGSLSKEEKAEIKTKCLKSTRRIMVLVIALNVGLLVFFKYLGFITEQINAILAAFGSRSFVKELSIIAPLGISFYTFQTIGYLIDVYWDNIEAERSFPRFFLFASFFPHITQGPISVYRRLAPQLAEPHSFEYTGFSFGLQRMLWGFFKKLVIADTLSPVVAEIFGGYSTMGGITVFLGMFCYSVQIYADFSGYMDIMCGLCQILGIELDENFCRPYFSKSVAEYWRRWHITLGDWFKSYIYYPVAVAGWNKKLGKALQGKKRSRVAQTIPASIALIVVWLTTGLWHGASWAYIAWGVANGVFIIFDLWMTPVYQKLLHKLRVNESCFWFRAFRVIRTFILITFIKILPEVGTLSQGLGLWRRVFTGGVSLSFIGEFKTLLPTYKLAVVVIGIAMMLTVSLLQRKRSVRSMLNKYPIVLRWSVYLLLVLLIVIFGTDLGNPSGGFMYANF